MHAFLVSRPEMVAVAAASPDAFFLHPDTSIGIAEVRQIQHFLSRRPINSPQATVVIHQAHLLTVAAQNALLKTLEEPPQYGRIYLVTDQPDALLPTVLSRVQQLSGPPVLHISPADLKEAEKLWRDLAAAPPIGRLAVWDKAGLTRESALKFLDHLEYLLHRQIISCDYNLKPGTYDLIVTARRHLKANVNVKLALDHFALDLTHTS